MTLNTTGVFHFITKLFHLAHIWEKVSYGEKKAAQSNGVA